MIPLQRFSPEKDDGEDRKDSNGDNLLYHLELHERKGTAITYKSDAVGRYLTGILKKRQKPADEDNDVERCVVRDKSHLLQLQMTIPSKCHEDVGNDKQ